jgi:hypothetical protein
MTLQLVLVKIASHPALQSTLILINYAMDSLGSTCLTKTVGRPGMVMLHVCVDLTLLPSCKFIVSRWIASRRLWMGVPSITKIEAALMSAIACNATIVNALIYCGDGAPNRCRATAARFFPTFLSDGIVGVASDVQFEVMIVLSSSSFFNTALIIWVGYKDNAETKWLHLCAIVVSAPHHQYPWNSVLCIPLVHGSHPWLMYSCAFAHMNPSWWLGLCHAVGHVMDVCLSLMSNPHE